jgi:ribosomal protein L37AE/L43A
MTRRRAAAPAPAVRRRRRPACRPPRAGRKCPRCRAATLDYDSLLELRCPRCGRRFGGGGFT